MANGKARIETPDQWSRTKGEYATRAQVQEKDGSKYASIKMPMEFQGRSILLEASHDGKYTKPTPPFRIEYVLLNTFSLFAETADHSAKYSGLIIADDSPNKWVEYEFFAEGSTDRKRARISMASSEGQVTRLKIELDEPEIKTALSYADKLISGILDYVCFSKEIPLSIHHIDIYESKTNHLVQHYGIIPYRKKVQLDEQLLFGMTSVPQLLVPLLRLFREGVNSTNPYYRLLCLYRVGEGLKKTVRKLNNERVKNNDTARKRPKSRIPDNEFTRKQFQNWIGKSMDSYLDHVEHNFRKYIAHMNIDAASLNLVPDPGSTNDAYDTDKVNGMLISIIRQLIFDEWTFMKENGIET